MFEVLVLARGAVTVPVDVSSSPNGEAVHQKLRASADPRGRTIPADPVDGQHGARGSSEPRAPALATCHKRRAVSCPWYRSVAVE